MQGDKTPIGSACLTLAHLAKTLDNELIRNEYVSLFIGVGRGEILPFASYYLTGFLNDRPLANLRSDMSAIGIRRAEGVKEPEDHIASLFDMMSGLIRGRFGRRYSIAEQATFFRKHIEPWADLLMRDIGAAKTVVFFAPVGAIGLAFLEIESQASVWMEQGSVRLLFYRVTHEVWHIFGGKNGRYKQKRCSCRSS